MPETATPATVLPTPVGAARPGMVSPQEAIAADSGGIASDPVDVANPAESLPPFPAPWSRPIQAAVWMGRSLFGVLSLMVVLAVLAAIPIVNLVALGYLLEVEGRVGRSGRLRDAFPLLPSAPRIGSLVLGVWLCVIPLRLLAGAAVDAHLIDPGSTADRWRHTLLSVAWILATGHICLALARGGSLGCFFRPWKNVRWFRRRLRDGDYLETAAQHVRRFTRELRLTHHFWLGLRGFAGAFVWLFVPTALFAAVEGAEGPQVVITVLGGTLLGVTLSWMPFLQARFAAEQRLRSMWHLRTIRRLFTAAPFAWLLAILVVYVSALPMYLLKVALPPQDAYWLITILFIASIYPARVVTGWAYHRAVQRESRGVRAGPTGRWVARLGMLPLLASFVVLLYFTQFIGAHGTAGLFEHHAFLLPWPGSPP